jgi:Cft2 family RNA processing exonuclease
MRLKVLGAYGAELGHRRCTSLLLDGSVLLDAGSAAQGLTVQEVRSLTACVLTHSHIDHVKSLPLLLDARIGCQTLEVHATRETVAALRVHLFNDVLWPDLEAIPDANNPFIRFHVIDVEAPFTVDGITFTAVPVNHTVPTVGYLVKRDGGTLVVSGDTAETERIWELARAAPDVRAVILDLSFPKRLHQLGVVSKHLTTVNLEAELDKMPPGAVVYLSHLKPVFLDELLPELAEVQGRRPNVRLLEQDVTIEI